MLEHRNDEFLNFRHFAWPDSGGHAYRWVHVGWFTLTAPDAGDHEVLEALVAHERFRNAHAGGGVEPHGTRHGPYWLENVTAASYEPTTTTAALDVLTAWATRYDPLPDALAQALASPHERVLPPTATAHHLRDLGQGGHDWGGVHDEFHEFVSVDRVTATVALMVSADD
ncbi:hypothetical protein KCV87_02335 [Actinosynnema pretiosum subsp. pretiosum]|uniref:Uncharacterized protein n=1 Tax=Actinosynnema pretiosum subsp. pretiosum TaxID=103721 RepID=A0AA45L7E6_9PSEU|nr:hypothetical protein APASM_3544 [Actinosynnema pretiosum subsp. pretiosum]QUF04989.1 hypothetical protein KCV87_02335 [Actinosynnema pretiosum subsp. pretiosum]